MIVQKAVIQNNGNNISSENSISHYEDENQCEFGNNSMARK